MAQQVASIGDVKITSEFWSRLQRLTQEHTLPSIIKAAQSLDHWECLKWGRGHVPKPHPFWDSDMYKVVEAACYSLTISADDYLQSTVEAAVDMIIKAQHTDGYLNSYYTVTGLEDRWTNVRDMHELYCVGHFLEAAVAYQQLTRNGRILETARKAIDYVASVFGTGDTQKHGYPGHQEIELGLLRFYEETDYKPALDLATYFINERGRRDEAGETYYDHEAQLRGADPYDDQGTEHKAWYHGVRDYAYQQADEPLKDASQVKGHAVRAMYYYAAATDLVRLSQGRDTVSAELNAALMRLWRDMVDCKMYVTGGIGSVSKNEGFGPAYLLDDLESQGCYAETCAAFGLINWCHRLLRLRLDVEYADIMELCLYNAFLGALNAKGDAFYYQNVLRTLGGHPKERSNWFGCACCPPNVAKLLCSLGQYIYTFTADKQILAVHLYIGSSLTIPGTDVTVTQESAIPDEGKVSIAVKGSVRLALRIPGWATTFHCSGDGKVENGYLHLPQVTDSTISIEFSMDPHKVFANPKTGKDEVCLMRGPLVYCIEDVDNPIADIDSVALLDGPVNDGPRIEISILPNVPTVTIQGKQLIPARSKSLYTSSRWQYDEKEIDVIAIPYFLRANRGGTGAMRVWTKLLHTAH